MEENDILEQPTSNLEYSQFEHSNDNMGQSISNENVGSNNFKFKSVEALNDAYNSLQAEFTKKCQHLRELERSIVNNNEPRYKLDSWNAELGSFFENNPMAKEYSKEIAKQILENEELAKKSDCLTIAWANILNAKYKSEADLVKDKDFLEKYIYSNESIKEEIIKKYLGAVEKSPVVMTGSTGAFNIAPSNKPKNMQDAYLLASKLFK